MWKASKIVSELTKTLTPYTMYTPGAKNEIYAWSQKWKKTISSHKFIIIVPGFSAIYISYFTSYILFHVVFHFAVYGTAV